ncbi:bifunctional DNA primase/polymerase [Sphingorhabdus lacus]|uniref:DNA primase/polymerase bifunctional N-terminal domain-containing protein n=1 Tax=Sphingorhabdus lacus TaxID=392610 RepID=A0A6I6LEE4_9SPHN|nr:bifunctional DNA primase/polymerase [Sphingorhabdus lacus]QGY80812.1 hypothetical protein EUU25_09380 [Sphingorhabdus lacus]
MSDDTRITSKIAAKQPTFLRSADFIALAGKRPVHKNWTTDLRVRFDADEAEKRLLEGKNVGVVLGAYDLVVDVDPRNGGDDSWQRLQADLAIDASAFPTVQTGSGGLHVYMRLPVGVGPLKNDLSKEGYPGVELKCIGRQVVAPGSCHPDTGREYVVIRDIDPLEDDLGLPFAPFELIALGEKNVASSACGSGNKSPEWLADALEHLDVSIYSGDHDRWLELMMACHDATSGAGCDEFVLWSIGDSAYADQAEVIARRWDGLSSDATVRITAGTLYKHLSDAGVAHLIKPDFEEAANDFDDVDPLDEPLLLHAVSDTKAKRQANAQKAREVKAEKGKLRKLEAAASLEDYANWLNATFVYDRATGNRINVETGEVFDDRVFENENGPGWARSGGKGSLLTAIKTGKAGINLRSVKMAAWFPGRERFVAIDMGTHEDHALNVWYDTTLAPVEGNHEWFENEVERLFPDDKHQQSILLDYWAARCMEPGRKVRWQLVIESAQGIGKGQMKNGFNTLFGWSNCGTFGVTQILDKYNNWQVSSANLFGEEIGFGTWKEAKAAYENMKAPITDDFIAVRPMQRESQVRVPNGTNYIVHRNPGYKFYCPDDDRRICYLQPCPEEIDEKGRHNQQLAKHYSSKEDMAAVRWWLINVWARERIVMSDDGVSIAGVGSVRFDEDPPMTEAKRKLIRDSFHADGNDVLDYSKLENVIKKLDLFAADDVLTLVKENHLDRLDATDEQLLLAIRKWLNAVGYKKHSRNTNGASITLYSPINDEKWSNIGPAERERQYLFRAH